MEILHCNDSPHFFFKKKEYVGRKCNNIIFRPRWFLFLFFETSFSKNIPGLQGQKYLTFKSIFRKEGIMFLLQGECSIDFCFMIYQDK